MKKLTAVYSSEIYSKFEESIDEIVERVDENDYSCSLNYIKIVKEELIAEKLNLTEKEDITFYSKLIKNMEWLIKTLEEENVDLVVF